MYDQDLPPDRAELLGLARRHLGCEDLPEGTSLNSLPVGSGGLIQLSGILCQRAGVRGLRPQIVDRTLGDLVDAVLRAAQGTVSPCPTRRPGHM
jgi:hypothetical protein